MSEENHFLHSRGRVLEDLFFFKQDVALVEKKRQIQKIERNLKTLSGISGIANETILRKLSELDIRLEVLATLSVIPLIEVAWAGGEIDDQQREAVLTIAENLGIFGGHLDVRLFEHWLRNQPPRGMIESWIYYMQGLCQLLDESERQALKSDLLHRARKVVEAECSPAGKKSKVSRRKEDALLRLERAFEP
jgi:hypothetical protein